MAARSAFVDSSGWLALVRARDRRHDEAEDLLRRAIRERVALVTTNLVVAEVQRLLLHRVGIGAARAWLRRCEASPTLEILFPARDDHVRALEWIERLDDQRLTYTDAVSFAVMRRRRLVEAITFDADFTVAGFRPWGG